MLIVEPSNLVFLKTYNTEFDDIVIMLEQNSRPLEIEGKVILTFLVASYSIDPRTRKYFKGYYFCHFQEIYPAYFGKKYWIPL